MLVHRLLIIRITLGRLHIALYNLSHATSGEKHVDNTQRTSLARCRDMDRGRAASALSLQLRLVLENFFSPTVQSQEASWQMQISRHPAYTC